MYYYAKSLFPNGLTTYWNLVLFSQNRDRLSSFVMWAISTALKSDSAQMLQFKESHPRFTVSLEEEIYEDSLISKLLRWLSAAVILGKLSWKSNDLGPEFSNRLKLGTLQSLLDLVGNACDESIQNRFGCEDLLASSIFYLQQLLGINCRVLPSVVSALCLLFYATDFAGKLFWFVGFSCLAYCIEYWSCGFWKF